MPDVTPDFARRVSGEASQSESLTPGNGSEESGAPFSSGIGPASHGGAANLDLEGEEQETGTEEYFVDDLSVSFYEKGLRGLDSKDLAAVVARIGTKDLFNLPDSIVVSVSDKTLKVLFQTTNLGFLAKHGKGSDTKFVWHTELFGLIDPARFSHKLEGLLELELRKAEGHYAKWTRFSARPDIPLQHRKLERAPGRTPTSNNQQKEDSPSSSTSGQGDTGTSAKKPTCFVSPYKDRGAVVRPGFTGLRNLGNTCFINSTLQVLINTKELKEYFLKGYHYIDLNEVNPLGMRGELGVAFGDLMQEMWDSLDRTLEPSRIKDLVARKATQFANFAQHDAQEFLSFLLDGLHEDLNRVRHKPATEAVEGTGQPDIEVAEEAWRRYLLRNDSVIVDLFHGQLKSRLECPSCSKVSITFDPFVYLPVPFPENKRVISFYFWPLDVHKRPVKMRVSMSEGAMVSDFFEEVARKVDTRPDSLVLIEDFQKKIWQTLTKENARETIRSFMENDVFYIFEVLNEEEVGEPVYNAAVIQRLVCRKRMQDTLCHSCGKDTPQLRACTNCYEAFYCGSECQKKDWAERHKTECRYPRSPVELVGHPFLISVPRSKATYTHITQLMEARARFTVEIFIPPVACKTRESLDLTHGSDTIGGEEAMDVEEDEEDAPPPAQQQPQEGEDNEEGLTPLSADFREQHPEWKLFYVRFCSARDGDTDHAAGGLNGKALSDRGEEPLRLMDIQDGPALAMDWINKKFSEDFVMVKTKRNVDHDLLENDGETEGLTNNLHLTDLLKLFAEKEILSDQECWYCSECKEHVDASKALLLWKLPSLLIVQLKRFVYSSHIYSRSKNDKSVRYPLQNLDMKPYLCPGAPDQETLFDLYGVVCHSGNSYFGHYISHGRLPDYDSTKTQIGWRLFNDSFVSESQPHQAIDEDAYLLFYKRRGAPSEAVLSTYDNLSDLVPERKEAYEAARVSVLPPTSSSTDDLFGIDQAEENSGGFSELPNINLFDEEE